MGETVDENDLKQCTIKRVSVSGLYNDLAYYIGNRLIVMFEHQSTMSPNMPYRMLGYIVEEYKRLYSGTVDDFVGTSLVKIRPPQFFVIYSGKNKWKIDELKLSDAYEKDSYDLEPQLESKVKVITADNYLYRNNILNDYFDFYGIYYEVYSEYRKSKNTDHVSASRYALDVTFR